MKRVTKKNALRLVPAGIVLLCLGTAFSPPFDCSVDAGKKSEILSRGKNLFFESRYGEAMETWSSVKEDFPCSFQIDKWRARALIMAGRPAEAVELLSPYLVITPEHPELLMLLGMGRLDMGETEQALALLDEGDRFLTGAAGLYLARADACYRFGLDARAARAKNKARIILNLNVEAAHGR